LNGETAVTQQPPDTTLTFTLADLAISPLNVRFNEKDANAVEALSASIVEQGLLEQLLIHPAPDGAKWAKRSKDCSKYGQTEPASFGVLAGGRRYRAIRLAIGRGLLPADFPIRAVIKDLSDQQIVLLSLSENLLRRDLQGYEVHAAIARLRGLGMSIEEIARNLGQEPGWVAQQSRLGELHPPIFEAYAAGDIDVEQARAFAATEEQALQANAWEHFARRPNWDRRPDQIRTFYKVGDHQLAKLLRLVGVDVYRHAGGHFELDLFAGDQDHRGRVADEDLLQRLAEEKLDKWRTHVREVTGRRDLRFAVQPPQRHGYNDTALEIHCDTDADLPQDLPDEAILATFEIASTGAVIRRFWWASRKAQVDFQKGKTPASRASSELLGGREIETEALTNPATYGKDARAIARDEHGLTASGLEVCRSIRRDILRWGLLRDATGRGGLGLHFVVFTLLRVELGRESGTQLGVRHLSSGYGQEDKEDRELARTYCQSTAREAFAAEVEAVLAANWMTEADLGKAFTLFLKVSPERLDRAAAVLAGVMLIRSANAPGFKVPLHDALAAELGLDAEQTRRAWTPDYHFTGLLSKMKRLEHAQPFVPAHAFSSWRNLGDKPLSAASAHVLAASPNWVHPVVGFDFDGFSGSDDIIAAQKQIETEALHEEPAQ
jgi:ParB family chromosome partitioning protein